MRAIFFEKSHARAVVGRLRRDGFEARVVRERLQGEDDDEDHPWAVLSDAPEFLLDALVDDYDGWLDIERFESEPLRLPPPPPLPVEPKRHKRP